MKSLLVSSSTSFWRSPAWLIVPAVLFLTCFFVVPIAGMVRNSLNHQLPTGIMQPGLTLDSYIHFFSTPLYRRVLATTLRVGLVTTVIAAVVAYPLAWAVARGPRLASQLVLVIVVSPLLINIVTRTFGWRIVLGRTGPVNQMLEAIGIGARDLLYTESAVVIGSLHVFLPLMVLPLANAIGAIPRSLEESAAALGAGRLETFFKIVLPMSLPGLGAGAILVFTLTASSFVLPAILGGDFAKMLGTLAEEQLLAVSNWPLGAAIGTIMMAMNLAVVIAYGAVIDRRLNRWAGRAS